MLDWGRSHMQAKMDTVGPPHLAGCELASVQTLLRGELHFGFRCWHDQGGGLAAKMINIPTTFILYILCDLRYIIISLLYENITLQYSCKWY